MNFVQVQGFILTAKKNSFAAAAKELGIYQQNLTVYMRKLEDELGVSLFVSDKRGTSLTDKGKELYPLFENITNSYNTLMSKCQNNTILKIGVDSVFFQPKMNDYIYDFRMKNPNVKIDVLPCGRYYELPEKLKNGEIDLFFGYYRDDLDYVLFHELFVDQVCVAYGGDLFKNKRTISLKDLEGLNIYYDNERLYKNRVLLEALNKKNINYRGIAGQAESIIDLHVINGEGVMIIHGSYIGTLSSAEYAVPIRGLKVPYGVYYRKNDYLAQDFINFLK